MSFIIICNCVYECLCFRDDVKKKFKILAEYSHIVRTHSDKLNHTQNSSFPLALEAPKSKCAMTYKNNIILFVF